MESELQTELVKCPNCGTLGPNTKFCLSCGTEKSIEDSEDRFQDDLVQKLDESVDQSEEEFDERTNERKNILMNWKNLRRMLGMLFYMMMNQLKMNLLI